MASADTSLPSRFTGICPAAVPFALESLLRRRPAPIWIVLTETLRDAEKLADDLEFATALADHDSRPVVRVMPENPDASMEMREAFAASSDRLAALSQLRARRSFSGESWKDVLVVVTTPLALLQPVPAVEAVREREIKLEAGATRPFQELVTALKDLDYDHEPVCEQPKQYAVRGGIIDVWPVAAASPVRLDFFGDMIEEIREFDPVTQRSGGKVA